MKDQANDDSNASPVVMTAQKDHSGRWLDASGAYKFGHRDEEHVEEHTSNWAEEPTDEELDQAMDDLNREGQEISDADWDEAEEVDG